MFKKSFKKNAAVIVVLISIIFVVCWHFFLSKNKKVDYVENVGVSVHFIDVGQGDCELILSDKKSVLIDGGERDKGSFVVRYLKKCGIKELDYIVATHPHTDHIGGLGDVIDSFDVKCVVMPKINISLIPTNSVYKKFLQKIKDKQINVKRAKNGDVLNLGEGVLNIIGPVKDDYKTLNNFSVGTLFKYDGVSFLMCGDMEKEAEKDVLNSGQNIKADVFKLSHHGSGTSNTRKFLKAVKPHYCVAEVGAKNSYGHPHRNVLNLIKKLGIKRLFRTDIDGSIIFSVKDKKLYYKTENGDKVKN